MEAVKVNQNCRGAHHKIVIIDKKLDNVKYIMETNQTYFELLPHILPQR